MIANNDIHPRLTIMSKQKDGNSDRSNPLAR